MSSSIWCCIWSMIKVYIFRIMRCYTFNKKCHLLNNFNYERDFGHFQHEFFNSHHMHIYSCCISLNSLFIFVVLMKVDIYRNHITNTRKMPFFYRISFWNLFCVVKGNKAMIRSATQTTNFRIFRLARVHSFHVFSFLFHPLRYGSIVTDI